MEQKRIHEGWDVHYVFMDTGAEHPKTYDFIRRIVQAWNINLICLRANISSVHGVGVTYTEIGLDELQHDLQPWKDMVNKYGLPTIESSDYLSSLVISARQTLYDKSKKEQISIEEKRFLLASLMQNAVEQKLILDVTFAYLNLLKSRDDLAFSEKQLQAFSSRMERAESRLEVGISTENDVLEVRADRDNALAEQIFSRNQVSIRLQELIFLVGSDVQNVIALNVDNITDLKPLTVTTQNLANTSLQRNPNLLISNMNIELAKNLISLESSKHYPTLELIAEYSETDIQQLETIKTDTSFVGLSFKLPIFAGGMTSAKVDSAKETFIASSERYRNQSLEVKKTISIASNTINSLVSRISALERLSQSANELC